MPELVKLEDRLWDEKLIGRVDTIIHPLIETLPPEQPTYVEMHTAPLTEKEARLLTKGRGMVFVMERFYYATSQGEQVKDFCFLADKTREITRCYHHNN